MIDAAAPQSRTLLSEVIILQGTLYSIGKKDDLAVFVLFDRFTESCVKGTGTVDMITQLELYLFKIVRIHGIGRWVIEPSGEKILKNYEAISFEPLNNGDLIAALDKIRKEGGFSGWKDVQDPHQEIMNYRYGYEQ